MHRHTLSIFTLFIIFNFMRKDKQKKNTFYVLFIYLLYDNLKLYLTKSSSLHLPYTKD